MIGSEPSTPSKWAVLIAVGLGYFITVMTTSFSVLALRAIADDFGVTLRTVGWVVIVESLIVAALLLPIGGLADRFGRNRTLRTGVAVFGLGLILTGLSSSFLILILARIVTALGNTLVQAVSTGILVATFPQQERGLALGGQTTAVAIGAATGPLLGGLLLDEIDWQLLFILLAIPVAFTFAVVHLVLGNDKPADRNTSSFDLSGAVLASSFITILVFTMNDPFNFGISSPVSWLSAALAAILLIVFVRVELSHRSPMLDVRLFQISDFRKAVAIRAVAFIASSSLLLLVPIYLLGVRDLSTRTTGMIMALFAVGMTVGAQISGRLYDRVGPRIPMVVGLTMQLGVLVLLAQVTEASGLAIIAVGTAGNGLGQGLWNVPANSIMMGAMPASQLGVGGAFTNVTRTVGSVLGQAGATAIVAGVMATQDFDIPLGDVVDTPGAGGAFVDGWQLTYIAASFVSALALAIAFGTNPAKSRVRSSA